MADSLTHTRKCARCLRRQSLDKFKQRTDGGYGYCYKCEIKYYREYNAKRYASPEARQRELERTKNRYHTKSKPARIARKLQLLEMMGGKCEQCGYNRNAAALDFDHIDPATKRAPVGNMLASPQKWEDAIEEAKRCRILCANCHRERTHPDWAM